MKKEYTVPVAGHQSRVAGGPLCFDILHNEVVSPHYPKRKKRTLEFQGFIIRKLRAQ
jgi:hypothetical protein